MIPISLTIKGINSYQEEHEIDFSRLIEGQLFGIFGPVGSGKSTLLEAMMIAIYGETERLNKRDDRQYNLMNLKSNELKIDFVFYAGTEDQLFRCVYTNKRHGKDFSKVGSPKHQCYIKEEGWQPISKEAIVSAIGLNYQNFRRTIIIPQGKFQEFLQLGASDRTRMLKEIFGLEKFDLYGKTKSINESNQLKIKEVEGGLKQLSGTSEAAITALEKEIQQLHKKIGALKEQLNFLKNVREIGLEVKTFQEQHLEQKQLEQRITKELAQAEKDYKEFQISFQKIQEDYQGLDQQKEALQMLDWMIKLKETQQSISKLSQQSEKKKKSLLQLETKEKEYAAQIQKYQEEIGQLNGHAADLKILNTLHNWFTQFEQQTFNIQKIKEKVSSQKEQNHQEVQTVLKKNFQAKHHVDSFEKAFEFLANKRTQTNTTLEKIQADLKNLELDQKLTTWAVNLEDGKPCPLCGSTDHPNPLNNEGIETNVKALEGQIHQFNQTLKKIDRVEKELAKQEGKWEEAQSHIKKLATELEGLNKEQRSHLDKFPDQPHYTQDQGDQLAKDWQREQKNLQKIQSLQKQLNVAGQSLKPITQQKSLIEKELESISNQSSALQGSQETYLSMIAPDFYAQYKSGKLTRIRKQKSEIEQLVKNTIAKFEQATKAKESRLQQIDQFKGSLGGIKENLSIVKEKLSFAEHKLKSFVESIPKFQSIVHLPLEWKKLEVQMKNLEQEVETSNQLYHTQLSQLDRLKADLKQKNDLEKELVALQNRGAAIGVLMKLFTGSGFVDFISSVYLRELCDAANDRFRKLTRERLQLEINEKNQFIIRDYLNQGKVRSVKTLSGGQLFQASLSLALALSEYIKIKNKVKQQFFFIDEGFGTQDNLSLQVIVKALKSLRSEGRIVGVISHVDQLKEEIDHFLRIAHDVHKGSLIVPGWENI